MTMTVTVTMTMTMTMTMTTTTTTTTTTTMTMTMTRKICSKFWSLSSCVLAFAKFFLLYDNTKPIGAINFFLSNLMKNCFQKTQNRCKTTHRNNIQATEYLANNQTESRQLNIEQNAIIFYKCAQFLQAVLISILIRKK